MDAEREIAQDGLTETERVFTKVETGTNPVVVTGDFVTTTPEGRTLAETIDGAGRTTRIEVPGIHPLVLGYDAEGRLSQIHFDAGAPTRATGFFYDDPSDLGFLSRVVDAEDHEVSFDYDAAGRVTSQVLPDLQAIGFTYTLNGSLESLTPPGRPAHGFGYSEIDLVDEYSPPDVAGITDPRTLFGYNLTGDLELVTRPDGLQIDPQYDGAGRLETRSDEVPGPSPM